MIESGIFILSDDGDSVQLQVAILDREGHGISEVTLYSDVDGLIVYRTSPDEEDNCPDTFIFDTPPLPEGRFPINLQVQRCGEGRTVTEGPFEFIAPGLDDRPGIPRRCSPVFCPEPTDACIQAQSTLQSTRNAIITKCNRIATLRAERETALIAAIALTIAAVLMFVMAAISVIIPFFGQTAATAFAIAGAAFLLLAAAAAGAAIAFQLRIRECYREIGTLRQDFEDARDEIAAECCGFCTTINTDLPECLP
ncbi:MAG: hypothetical protein AAFP76_07980 [Bacteroidota bacterium]